LSEWTHGFSLPESGRSRVDRFTSRAARRAGVNERPEDYGSSLQLCANDEVVQALRRAVRRSESPKAKLI